MARTHYEMEYKIALSHMFSGKKYGTFDSIDDANQYLASIGQCHWHVDAKIFESNAACQIIFNGRASILEGDAEKVIGELIEKLIDTRDHEENMRDDVYDSEWC